MKKRAKKIFKKSTLLFMCLALFSVPSIFAQDVQVYLDSTQQMIRGFGAANIVDWYGDDLNMDDVETAYGTGEGQLGFNILRLRIAPNPAAWGNGNQVETAKRVIEMGGIVWAAAWNPPSNMLDPEVNYNRLLPEYYDDYAAHLEDFNQYMAERDVNLYGISFTNEPDYGIGGGWTEWTPDEIVTFIRDHADSITTRMIAPESFQFRRNYSDPILNDSLANAKTDIIGGHLYGGGLAPYPLAEEKGKEIWMTEHYTSSDRSANIWPDALLVGREISQVMKSNWNAYIWWQIKRYYSPIHDGVDVDDPGRDFVDRANSGSITKRGWVMSQFSRFVRPGDYRVEASGPFGRGFNNVFVTSYTDTLNSKIVLVIVNNESGSKDINVTLNGGTTTGFSRYITSEDDDVEQMEDLDITGNTFSTTLPKESIITFVSKDFVAVSNEHEERNYPREFALKQNYPNPFNPVTTISYYLPATSNVTLKVYNLLGQEVASLVNGLMSAGEHKASFDASTLSSGIYIYRIEAGSYTDTKKMMLIK